MRAIALHPDVLLVTSAVLQVNCVIVRGGLEGAEHAARRGDNAAVGETFVIDSPVLPDELDALPALLEQAGFPSPSGLLATHGDWDHLLGGYAFPEAPLGAAETTAARLRNEIGAAQRELRAFDDELYVERPKPLALPGAQQLPVPGHVGVGERELELHPADGHTADGMAVWIPWARVLVAGDYLSPVEIPMLSPGGSAEAYLATLRRLDALVAQADHVVPGHGEPMDGQRAAAILREDRAYVEALLADPDAASLPLARRSGEQKRIHAENVERVRS
jgi:glyoxylase-like metal-dependent hydrolase (beta-lactamase superfamily II)